MTRNRFRKKPALNVQFPPSEPGWWTVAEARQAIEKGYAGRMMLEVAPEGGWAVLSPAFYGSEGFIAVQETSHNGCNFLKNNLCELFGTGVQPLECRFCHHERVGQGKDCHAALERDWHSPEGQALVDEWKKTRKIDIHY
jgi:hypothetical protein